MWIIAGTIPDPDFSLLMPEREGPAPRTAILSEAGLHLPGGRTVPVERGTAALAATALQTCAALGCTPLPCCWPEIPAPAPAAASSMPGWKKPCPAWPRAA